MRAESERIFSKRCVCCSRGIQWKDANDVEAPVLLYLEGRRGGLQGPNS